MTISTTQSSVTLQGNNSTSVFSFNFVVGLASNVNVYYNDGTTTTLLAPSQYTLNLTPPAVGSIWGIGGTVTYPTAGSPIANGTSITISRIVPITQLTSISSQGTLLLNVIEAALDTLCLEIQQVSSRTGAWRGTWQTGVTYNFGDIVQDGVNGLNTLNYYGCSTANTSGTFATDLANGDWQIQFNTQAIAAYSTAAAASAAAALVSQNAAASSATASAASAATSTTEAGIATTQAGIATTQAGNSATSASTASTQAGIATTQAGISTTQAGISTAQAATATTQATTATTQATNSSNSATASAASAAAALVSQNAAATSAVLAGSALSATSITSLLIGTGSKVFTTQANKNFFAGQFISAASNANALNYMHGQVTSYSGTTLTINVLDTGGSGTLADWNISVSGTQGSAGGGGSVTTVSVVSANGLAGSVANPTTTPAITLSTSITGVLKGNGTAISAATSGSDYAPATSGSSFLKGNAAGGFTNQASIALTDLATQAADTFLANATGGSATPTAVALAASQLAGRGSSGDIAAISLGTNISMSGTTLNVAGGSELVLLATATAASSSLLAFNSAISSSYSSYILVFNNLLPSTAGTIRLQCSTDNGSTFVSTLIGQGGAVNMGSASAPTYSSLGNGVNIVTLMPSTATSTSGYANFVAQTGAGFVFQSFLSNNDGLTTISYVADKATVATNAFKLVPSAGTFTSGTVYLYGIKNT